QGRTLAVAAKDWRAERAARAATESVPSGLDGPGAALPGEDLGLPAPGWADRFGRRRLQRRIDRLQVSVLSLGEGRPDLAADLDPVLAALEEVGTALDLAATLSLARRIRAHQRVDAVIDALETSLFEAALPQLPGSSSPER
ncbi:MAG: hypothetical protein KDA94_15060, partial [Acidimicrobiales bacterium]|nr:hypothetical protein [Acidimicrobiales bacterium]